jgi:3-deoxy-D-manno-octulosonate 8-phosphate phosphatase (KDO 8-P phosphatase)
MVITLPDGDQVRRMNIKDGYALQHAVKKGYHISIISGGTSESVRKRLNGLGIKEVNLSCKNKIEVFEKLQEKYDLKAEEILYMGDDIPDYKVMQKVGFAACPKDAAEEIKSISHYISPKKGGEGCVRDLIEQLLKLQGKWFDEDSHEW